MRKLIRRCPKPLIFGLLTPIVVSAYGWVGSSDYEEALASAEFYCQMSESGAWPVRPELNCPNPEVQAGIHLVSL